MAHRVKLWLIVVSILCLFPAGGAQAVTYNGGLFDAQSNIVQYADTGEIVVLTQIRLRELDYFYFKPTGKFQSMTRDKVIAFQKNQEDAQGNAIIADGTIGQQSVNILFSTGAVRAPIAQHIHLPIGAKHNGTQAQTGVQRSWKEMMEALVPGNSYRLMDYNTGTQFSMTYTGGVNHAEMECASANDTAAYKEAFGAEFNYSKRPMLLDLNGTWIACSLQGQPHGTDEVARNEMDGHACLFFYESKSHVGAMPDNEHTSNIYVAAGKSN